LGQFEGHGNIGSRRNAGAASYDAFSQEHEIAGSAVNVRGVKDDLHFVWKRQPFTANRGRNKRLTSHNPGESATGQET